MLNAGFVGAKPIELNVTVTERFACELLVLLKFCLTYYVPSYYRVIEEDGRDLKPL